VTDRRRNDDIGHTLWNAQFLGGLDSLAKETFARYDATARNGRPLNQADLIYHRGTTWRCMVGRPG
jgi:hypothetical protein